MLLDTTFKKTEKPQFGKKGKALIEMYESMATEGYSRRNGEYVQNAFSDFELRPYRELVKTYMKNENIRSVLDYGCGGSDWRVRDFDPQTGESAIEYFGLEEAYRYEPARDIDERCIVDCVVSFDVLEHIFITDIPNVLRDIFSYASRAVILNIACYPAGALLPNGENAHITVRPPLWWKGVVDMVATEYPDITIYLLVSTGYHQTQHFQPFRAGEWEERETFVIPL